MRLRGLFAIFVVVAVVLGVQVTERIGPATPDAAASPTAISGSWFCPHGGGKGWVATIALANPGDAPVDVRLTTMDADGVSKADTFEVPAGLEVQRDVPADRRSSATYVETFGGWVSAGWIVRAASPDTGIGAEPCASTAGGTWFAAGGSTEQGEEADLVLMNPFAEDAVVNVILFSSKPPVRSQEWSDVVVPARRSIALKVNDQLVGEPSVGAEIDAKVGRIAVATLGITDGGGVRSVLGSTVTGTTAFLPTGAGAGQSTLHVVVPGDRDLHLGATLLTPDGPAPAGGLIDQEHRSASAAGYPVVTSGTASIDVNGQGGVPFFAAQVAAGRSADDAATAGAVAPGRAFVVPPTVVEQPSFPGLVLANPGQRPVTVTLRLLPPREVPDAELSVTVEVPPASAVAAPKGFLDAAPQASVLVTADGGIVALGASSSSGIRGLSLYGLAVGVPVPVGAAALP